MDKYSNNKICKFYAQGYCKFKNCRFEHPEMEYRVDSKSTSIKIGKTTWISNENIYNKNSNDSNGKIDKPIEVQKEGFNQVFNDINYKELFKRFSLIKQDLSTFVQFEQSIESKTNLDLMFIVDCTGSMCSWITTVNEELKKIIRGIKTAHPHSKVRVSFVGYRDLCDENRFSILDFESDIDTVIAFINNVKAEGGGDTPEDVAGGLNKALQQNWKSPAKYAILICDAPCHGVAYHNISREFDDYPDKPTEGLVIEKLIAKIAKSNIVLSAIEIGVSTKKMLNIMSNTYKKCTNTPISIAKLDSHNLKNDFSFHVSQGASSTLSSISFNGVKIKDLLESFKNRNLGTSDKNSRQISQFVERINESRYNLDKDEVNETIEKSMKNCNENKSIIDEYIITKLKTKRIPKKELNFPKIANKTLKSICYSLTLNKDINNQIDWKNPTFSKSEIRSEILLNLEPFSEGVMRYSFYMYDLKLNQELVGKINKNQKKSKFNLNELSKDMESLIICQHLSNEFNDRIINIIPDTRLLLNFVDSYIYELVNPPDEYSKFKYLFTENYIKGEYKKYNNNSGWTTRDISESSLIADCFSHFSWQYSKGYLIIVDLQGVEGFLTDPQIHCLNPYKYGEGNFGYFGIIKYFLTHICNKYCERLNLLHPKNNINMENRYFSFYDTNIEKPKNPKDMIMKQCCLCRVCFKIQADQAYLIQLKKKDLICPDCNRKMSNSKISLRCKVCNNQRNYSDYYYKMKRIDFPSTCENCR